MSRRATPALPKTGPRSTAPSATSGGRATVVGLDPAPRGENRTGGSAFDPLVAFSGGRIARDEAIRLLGLRDYAELLIALGDADLPMPLPTPEEIEAQASTFVMLWNKP